MKIGMPFRYTAYARRRITERAIPEPWIAGILAEGQRYRDTQTNRLIAVARQFYIGKERDLVVVFEQTTDVITVITLFALRESERERRTRSGRWVPP